MQVGSPAATVLSLSPVAPWTGVGDSLSYPQASVPAPAGSEVATFSVVPVAWTGNLALSGSNAGSFAISGNTLIVGDNALPAGSYAVTVTASP